MSFHQFPSMSYVLSSFSTPPAKHIQRSNPQRMKQKKMLLIIIVYNSLIINTYLTFIFFIRLPSVLSAKTIISIDMVVHIAYSY
uniref:Uncharacterized protein n=1 Tax=Pararge aegeria TaxID=116150 RepID=S4PWB3_9NEOP